MKLPPLDKLEEAILAQTVYVRIRGDRGNRRAELLDFTTNVLRVSATTTSLEQSLDALNKDYVIAGSAGRVVADILGNPNPPPPPREPLERWILDDGTHTIEIKYDGDLFVATALISNAPAYLFKSTELVDVLNNLAQLLPQLTTKPVP